MAAGPIDSVSRRLNHQTSDEWGPLMSTHPRRQVLGAAAGAAVAATFPLATPAEARAGAAAGAPAGAAAGVRTGAAGERQGPWVPVPDPITVPLDAYLDNDGIDTAAARGGNFDGSGYTFPGEELPAGHVEVDGISFLFPSSAAGAKNNVVAMGQRIDLPKGRYLSALFLPDACSSRRPAPSPRPSVRPPRSPRPTAARRHRPHPASRKNPATASPSAPTTPRRNWFARPPESAPPHDRSPGSAWSAPPSCTSA